MRIKLGFPLSLSDISSAMGGRLSCGNNPRIEYITTDSREAKPGDLFIPIKGSKYDGEDFVDVMIKNDVFSVSSAYSKAHVLVQDTTESLLNCASFFNKNLPYILYRIGITGSVGKTTTKEFTKILLSERYKVHANEGNFNNEVGLPMSILSATCDSQILIMEMGMNHLGEISKLSKCLYPNMAIITNIGTSHIGNLGSRENIARAKLEISDGMQNGRIYVSQHEELLSGAKNKVNLSLTDKTARFYLESQENRITIYTQGKKYAEANFAFSERHLKECLLFASAVAIDAGLTPQQLSSGISKISADNIRQKLLNHNGYLFYTDFYNASAESILASFDSIKKIKTATAKNLLLGDVLELGEMSENIHYKIGKSIPSGLFKNIFLFGNLADDIARGAVDNGFPADRIHKNYDLSSPEFTVRQIKHYCKKGELILMKASRGVRLERVLEYFIERS